jgi:hypothetical protein
VLPGTTSFVVELPPDTSRRATTPAVAAILHSLAGDRAPSHRRGTVTGNSLADMAARAG